jgi:hypothetical protein
MKIEKNQNSSFLLLFTKLCSLFSRQKIQIFFHLYIVRDKDQSHVQDKIQEESQSRRR